MRYFLAPFRLIYKLYFAAMFALSVLLFAPFFMIAVSSRKNGFKYGFNLRRVWSRMLEYLCFTPLVIRGKKKFPKKGPYIVVANHKSYLDIILMYGVVPHKFRFLGKAEILRWPVINWVFRKMDIPVERTNKTKAYKSLERCGKALDRGDVIIIFPEGGWDPKNKGLQRFKNGAFKLAIEKNVPVVPMTYATNYQLFCDHTDLLFNGRPGVARTIIHEPIQTKKLTHDDLVSLRKQAFKAINSELPDDY